jgi:hypothetical protein
VISGVPRARLASSSLDPIWESFTAMEIFLSLAASNVIAR